VRNLDLQLSTVQLTGDITEAIKHLWAEDCIKQTFSRGDEFQIDECSGYFFDNLKRISAPKYVPVVDDILQVRVKTTGITETLFGVGNNLKINMVDVGGQRNERKKWIHCFQDTTAIVFVVAISEYNQNTEEDMVTNRMDEALKLFSDTINNKSFANSNIILFLNKKDLFKIKIEKKSS